MIRVRTPGMFTTVQDLGREGFGPLGVSPSGAADRVALQIGNRLLGNPDGAAALEMTLLGGAFEFDRDCAIAITGADFGGPAPMWQSHPVRAGEVIKFGGAREGARCYLCVQGGIAVPALLGSASTHILSGLGGLEGRALRKGDVLETGPRLGAFVPRRLNPDVAARLKPRKAIRVTRGLQWDWFTELTGTYRVTDDSNRMGLRLDGPPLTSRVARPMITEGAPVGAIQVPAGGQPIILFVEQQTTGGYPKIANVIAADLWSVGQLRPRDEVRFEVVSPVAAAQLICELEALLRRPDLVL